ncbi:hypothetical protein HQ533_01800 [Candidatus Woesearchaeota archaeon]|nr:hypothetical protein [Candidatus Woesearchaeota archaeon]
MKKEHINAISLALFTWGAFLILNSQASITGAVIGTSGQVSGIIGFLLILIAGVFTTTTLPTKGLEHKVKFFEEQRHGKNFISIQGMNDISAQQIIQTNYNPPIDEYHMNLKQLESLLRGDVVSEEDKAEFAEEYKEDFKEAIIDGYKSYFEFKQHPSANKKTRKRIAKKLRIARAAERVFRLLDTHYKTRPQQVSDIRRSDMGQKPYIEKPIREGKAAYVHFTSSTNAEQIKKRKYLHGEQQALFFPNLEEAEEFVENTSQNRAKTLTGANASQTAIIFQTFVPPEKINRLSGEKTRSMPKAFFHDLEIGTCYHFKTQNVSK